MGWRLAESLKVLRDQINKQWPKRNKASDGTIASTAHLARAPVSDHNPNQRGVVTALDITHDPKNGVDIAEIVEVMRESRDPRIKYIIANGRICNSTVLPWKWRKYTGSNPHSKHFHLSVSADPRLYDDKRPWKIVDTPAQDAQAPVEAPTFLHKNIIATVFNDAVVAYADLPDGWYDAPGAAFPYRFKGERPRAWVQNVENGLSVIVNTIDVGPWVTNDQAYVLGTARPQAERERLKLTSGPNKGKKTNLAGIDLNPAAADAIGLRGMGKVNWRFE